MRTPLFLLLLSACGAQTGAEALIAGATWTAAPQGADPIPSHEEPDMICGAGGFGDELGGVEIDTQICGYAVLQHELLQGFRANDTLRINWWHSDLVAEAPATGHLLLTIGGESLYEAEVDIPGDAQAYLEEFEPGFDADAGAPLVLHLHNHGFNTWNLFELSRL